MRGVYLSRKMLVLGLLGFSSGLPLYMTSRMLQAWLRTSGLDLATIGFLSLVALPYSLKFLWSPLVDRISFGNAGRRRSWLLASQLALTAAILGMSLWAPQTTLAWLGANAVLIALFSATQDIVVDAYRNDIVTEREAGAGAGVYILGYRVGMLVTGALAFVLADWIPWSWVYAAMAAFMAVGIGATWLAREPVAVAPPATLRDAVVLPFRDFLDRLGTGHVLAVLGFVTLYRIGDSMVSLMSTPFLLDLGFSQSEIGGAQGGLGLIATMVGVVAGGWLTARLGTARSLWVLGGLQVASNLSYWALAVTGRDSAVLLGAIAVENFCFGLVTSAFMAYLTGLCNARFSATQYALLSSLMAVSRDILASPSGAVAASAGWPAFFLISVVVSMPAFLLLPALAPWRGVQLPPDRSRSEA